MYVICDYSVNMCVLTVCFVLQLYVEDLVAD